MDRSLRDVAEAALRLCLEQVADESKGRLRPEDVARLLREKLDELLTAMNRGPTSWDAAPYISINQLYRQGMLNQLVRLQCVVEEFAVPAPMRVTLLTGVEERVVTEVALVDESRSSIRTLPITAPDLIARLDDFRIARKRFEVLGAVTDVLVRHTGKKAFRLLLLDVQPITSSLMLLRATTPEIEAADVLLRRLARLHRTPFEYLRQQVCEHLGIIETSPDDAFSRALDTTIVAAFSCGMVRSTPGNIHHLVVGRSGIGKKLLAQIARALHPVFAEIGVAKVTDAGLCGVAHRKDGKWTHTPGLLPRADGGLFVAEDVHELTPTVRRSLVGMLLKLLEDGRLLDSTAAATEYQIHASVHFDQNLRTDVWDGASSRLTFTELALPKHFLGRADIVTFLPPDSDRQRQIAKAIAGTSEGVITRPGWERPLRVLVAALRDRLPEPDLDPVASLLGEAVDVLCDENDPKRTLAVHFDDFLPRLAISLRKITKAICRSRALAVTTPEEVQEATRLLQAKIEFLAQLEPGVVPPASWASTAARQSWIEEEFGGQAVGIEEIHDRCAEVGLDVDQRTVRRDIATLGGQRRARGLWLLPPKRE